MAQLNATALLVCSALLAACGPSGSDRDDLASDALAWSEYLAEISVAGVTFSGHVRDDTGAPVAGAMLVLCGSVDGAEVCNQQYSQTDGSFIYQGLLPGYTHLQVLPYTAAADTGKLYAGVSLAVALPALPGTVDWGDIVLPVVLETETLVVAEGGLLELGPLRLKVAPGAAAFPDLHPAGPVGVIPVDSSHLPAQFEGQAAYAFSPFDTRLSQPAQVTITETLLGDALGVDLAEVSVWVNSTDHGGLYEVPVTVVDGFLTFEVVELTWVVLKTAWPGE